MFLSRCTESFEEFIEQENKFYLLYLVLGLIFSIMAWKLAAGISDKYNRRIRFKVKRIVRQLLVVKMLWCTCRCLHWLLTCQHFTTLPNKYNLLMILVERLAVLQILRLIKDFIALYGQLNQAA